MKEYDDYSDKNNKEEDFGNDNNSGYNTNPEMKIRKIYEENKKLNKMKIDTTEFMSYSIKVELLFQTLQGYLFWISIIEFVIFLVLFLMFCLSPNSLSKM